MGDGEMKGWGLCEHIRTWHTTCWCVYIYKEKYRYPKAPCGPAGCEEYMFSQASSLFAISPIGKLAIL